MALLAFYGPGAPPYVEPARPGVLPEFNGIKCGGKPPLPQVILWSCLPKIFSDGPVGYGLLPLLVLHNVGGSHKEDLASPSSIFMCPTTMSMSLSSESIRSY